MSVIIGCDSFLSFRNVLNGKLADHLKNLTVLVDPAQYASIQPYATKNLNIDKLIQFDPYYGPTSRVLTRTYNMRKAYYDSWPFFIKLLARSSGRSMGLRRMAAMVRNTGIWLLSYSGGLAGGAISGRKQCAKLIAEQPESHSYDDLFNRLNPKVVAGFSLEGPREMLLVETARARGIPTAVMIRSRDNITSKIRHLPIADKYMVWSEVLKGHLTRIYPEIDPKNIVITGSPQFDLHLNPEARLPRKEFFDLIGLDPNKPLIVYTMATPGIIEHEIHIVQHLADAAHNGKFVNGAQLLVRGHPRMYGSNLKLLNKEYPEAVVYPKPTSIPYLSIDHEAVVVGSILKDTKIHLSTLAYQDVQVNVCGTMTIDSAILNKPCVNIYYDLVPNVPFGRSLKKAYYRADIKQMMSYKASRLARDPEECIRLINMYLENPSLDAEGRRRAREEDCGPLDGKSGERVAGVLKNLRRIEFIRTI